MIKIKGICSYNGQNYFGWERQPSKKSVQGEIEAILSKILNTKIVLKVAGRTDKGVHAFGQVFSFFYSKDCPDLSRLKYAVNRLLPKDIKVLDFSEVDLKFDPKIDAIKKEYEYRIYIGEMTPLYKDSAEIFYEKLDLKKMIECKKLFLGKHNFKNYTVNKEDSKKFIREIYSLDIKKEKDMIFINIVGSGFMRYMVRFIVGDLVLCATGKIDENGIKEKLEGKEHKQKICKVSPQGLYLKKVVYPMSLKYCYHTHTYRCGHAQGDVEDYVKQALKFGIKILGFSDHVMLPNFSQPGIRGEYYQLEDYIEKIEEAQRKYKSKIQIFKGFECEYFEKYISYYKQLLDNKKLDYLILGNHFFIDKKGHYNYFGSLKNNKESSKFLRRYGNDVVKAMSTGLFKYVAHPDLFMYNLEKWDSVCEDITKKICEASIKYDVPLEINFGPSRTRVRKIVSGVVTYGHPFEKFWEIVEKYKCKVILGVDAHNPLDFERSNYEYLEEFLGKFNFNLIDNLNI